jgi:hypothetical protein
MSFLQCTRAMLCDRRNAASVHWGRDGTSIVIEQV